MKRFGVVCLPFVIGVAFHLCGCDLLPFGRPSKTKSQKVDRRAETATSKELSYVGRETCGKCHEEAVQGYAWSAHDRSTELARGEAVEAPFAGEKLSLDGLQATFLRKDGAPVISADKEDPVTWTIGYSPLQQYIVPRDRGRYQRFPAAFDTRNKGDGGKRWYVPNEADGPTSHAFPIADESSIWNANCARCHSTAVEKNYNFETDTYDTKFKELDVSCEACHGPASRHVALAEEHAALEKWPTSVENAGFNRAISPYALRRWARNPDESVAKLMGEGEAPPEKTDELLICAPCHSTSIDLGPSDGGDFLSGFSNRFALTLLDEPHFFSDGQVKNDVYTYNSFIQTKKHHAGVVCSDCHDPHAGTLRTPALDICNSCHSPDKYSAKDHTMHETRHDVSCVDCHMPEKPFLGADTRRDHSFPIPRPDLALSIDLPNACETCHAHRPKWIQTTFEDHFGRKPPAKTTEAFHAATTGAHDAPEKLNLILTDKGAPEIVRASALERWAELGRITPALQEAIVRSTRDESVLVRRVAAEVSPALAEETRLTTLTPLFTDSARTVRIAAALAALTAPPPKQPSEPLMKALGEAKTAQAYRADTLDGLLALAALEGRLGTSDAESRLYDLALTKYKSDPRSFSAWATVLSRREKVDQAQVVVMQGLKLHPTDPELLFSRGRYLLRQGKAREALSYLQGAFEAAPRTRRREAGYVYAVTVHELGDWAEALAILRLLKREYPEAPEVEDALNIFAEKRSTR